MRAWPSLLALVAVACGRSAEPERRAELLEPEATRAPAAEVACRVDADCSMCSNGECGVPIARAAASSRACTIGALCEPWNPICQRGQCEAVPPPAAQRCRTDDDCGMCLDGSRCGQPMALSRMRALGAACERGSAAGCRPLVLLCHEGRCKDASLLNQ